MSTPTYEALAVRDGEWWAVTVQGMPAEAVNIVQGKDWTEATANAVELVLRVKGFHACTVRLLPADPEEANLARMMHAARTIMEDSQAIMEESQLNLMTLLKQNGHTRRDIAEIVNMDPEAVDSALAATEGDA